MNNRLLQDEWLELFKFPQSWRFISTFFDEDVFITADIIHKKWHSENLDQHLHKEILFAIKGECVMSLEGSFYKVTPGTVMLFNKNEKHDMFYPPWTDGCVHLWLFIVNETIMPRIICINQGEYYQRNEKEEPIIHLPEICPSFLRIWTDCTKKNNSYPLALASARMKVAVENIILEYVHRGFSGSITGKTEAIIRRDKVVDTIKEYIYDAAGAGITLDRLAVVSGYSKYHLLRVFRERTGLSIREYVNQCRIIKCRDLLNKGYRKNEISEILGFSSPGTFSRWFNKVHSG